MNGVALVTGGGRGIGRAIALALAENGFDVAVNDLQDSDALQTTLKSIAAKGRRTVAVLGDIADVAQHEQLLRRAAQLGPLNCLVNNAGVSVRSRGDLLDVAPESYDLCQNVNTRGTFFLCQAFAKRLLAGDKPQTHRSIITITSANASAVSIARGEYCVSKAGASMVSKLFAARLSNDGIGVYEIQPGFIETEMTAPSKAKYDALIDGGLTVIKRFGQPDEVGRIAATLALGLLPYTSGQVIYADGGLMSVRY
jgi:NAD(P)-dependent dehydrogenase (short-subunit alcohol dehydrogenase family)